MLDPDTAPLDQLDRQLAALQRHYRTASHLVAERGERPDGMDDDTRAWWVAAHRAVWRRRHELNESGPGRSVDDVELRKGRLRKPARYVALGPVGGVLYDHSIIGSVSVLDRRVDLPLRMPDGTVRNGAQAAQRSVGRAALSAG
jgi:hypothetical protein